MPENIILHMQISFTKRKILSSILMGALFVLCLGVRGEDNNSANSNYQNDTLIAIESMPEVEETPKKERKHSPKLAALSSALVPGLGQAYNGKYWKVPIIWGGGLALYTYFDWNYTYYQRFKLAEDQAAAGDPVTDPDFDDLSEEALTTNRKFYRRHMERAIIFMGLLYVANIIDATVDGHLMSYDISKDLSLNWSPTLIQADPANTISSAKAYGVYVQLRF